MKQKIILHLVHRLTVGGAERVLVNLINGSSNRFRHIVCSFFEPDSFATQIVSEKRHVITLYKKPGNDWTVPFVIRSICKKFNVDLIHSQGWATYLEGIIGGKILYRKSKFIFAFRGKTADSLGELPKRRRYAQKICASFCNAILTPSEEMRQDYAHAVGINPERITVIPNGVNTRLFSPSSDKSAAKSSFGFTTDNIVIGCVARFDQVKNIPALIKGFAVCAEIQPDCRLLLVGDGNQLSEIKSTIKKMHIEKYVVLTGRRTDVADCLKAMDIYVQPSLYEGLSNTILESMSVGLPVIAYDVGGTRELVKQDINGILLNPALPGQLEKALAALVDNGKKCKNFGKKGREIIKENFSIQKMVASYENLFDRV